MKISKKVVADVPAPNELLTLMWKKLQSLGVEMTVVRVKPGESDQEALRRHVKEIQAIFGSKFLLLELL